MANDSSESGIGKIKDSVFVFGALKNLLMSSDSGKAVQSMGSLGAAQSVVDSNFDVPTKPTFSNEA